jgi:hypothetical protein
MFRRSLLSIQPCSGGRRCPDILELDSGDFAVIGTEITDEAMQHLPSGSICGEGECVVRIPRQVLIQAKPSILDLG